MAPWGYRVLAILWDLVRRLSVGPQSCSVAFMIGVLNRSTQRGSRGNLLSGCSRGPK